MGSKETMFGHLSSFLVGRRAKLPCANEGSAEERQCPLLPILPEPENTGTFSVLLLFYKNVDTPGIWSVDNQVIHLGCGLGAPIQTHLPPDH